MASEKEQVIADLTNKVLQESLRQDGKSRFGLFSVPPAGISGSSSVASPKKKNLGPDGKPATNPRGIYIGSPRTGKTESSYFSKVGYTTIGDPYVEAETRHRKDELAKSKLIKHDVEWRSSPQVLSDPVSPVYKHMNDFVETKKSHRGADGKVITENRNIFTTRPHPGYGLSTVGHLFSKPDAHMSDPYERKKELEKKEREEGRKKLQEQPFLRSSPKNGTFTSDRNTFSLDKPLPEKKMDSPAKSSKVHDAPFKPSNPTKKGYNATFEKYPEHKADPIRHAERKKEDPSQKKDAFKLGNLSNVVRPDRKSVV